MAYELSSFKGDDTYSLDCTDDAVVGDHVAFERATFAGSYRRPKFAGFEFTLLLENGDKLKIKGRNMYANRLFRQPWEDEKQRQVALDEKHNRGDIARLHREIRKASADPFKEMELEI